MSAPGGRGAGGSAALLLAATLTAAGCGERPPAAATVAAASAAATMAAASAAASAPGRAASPAAGTAPPLMAPSGQADRLPPPVVPPIERNGVVYAQAPSGRDVGLDQVGGVLVASEAGGGRRLWTLAVYPNPIDPAQEEDAQWIFFRSMAFDTDGRLRIVNEAGKAYLVDVGKRQVTPAP